MRKETHRMEKVNAQLRRLIGETIFSLYNSGNDIVTITEVDATRDLASAKIYLVAQKNVDEHVKNLNQIREKIKSVIRPKLDFRIIPNLMFIKDDKSDQITQVESLLDTIDHDGK